MNEHNQTIDIFELERELETDSKLRDELLETQALFSKTAEVDNENFRNLLLSYVSDVRVLMIMIADRLKVMRTLRDVEGEEAIEQRRRIAEEAGYLYAPLAHKLGLYKVKSELEDLSLKYLEHDAYYEIKENLNATKAARDAYIEAFIGPIQTALERAGLKFYIKGRTKSIHSIYQKMKKQGCGFNGIYDLFAIRIILDSEPEREKVDCWQTYSIIADMYQPNPKRLRDWLSMPKSNGYESLHTTVLGPQDKWVEVQIWTERMDHIAENGVAAHWRYKGVKLDLSDDKIYVFSPKGDLYKLPQGATVLDFAYYIHSNVGSHCVGAKINGKQVKIGEVLHSGESVEILTQSNQTPKSDWLNIMTTSRAKSKLRLALKESQLKEVALAKELLERRLKNRKIELEESTVSHLVSKLNYKLNSEFYMDIARGKLDVNQVIERYIEVRNFDLGLNAPAATRSAEEFEFDPNAAAQNHLSTDELVIDKNLSGIDYTLARCCNPIYGDEVFGFITVNEGIKIHRCDCPNAPDMRARFGYRIVRARWSGKGGSQYSATLRIVGNDDLGIVNNITSIISKEEKTIIRSINIDSNDGLFAGTLVVMFCDVG